MPKEDRGLSLDGQGIPLWLSLELTYRCPLKCSWCNNPLDFEDYGSQELSTAEWKKVLDDARRLGALQLGFTGGEPMLRDDLEAMPPVKLSDVEAAQKEIMATAKRLAEAGEITLSGKGEQLV